jgi:hypothetical protein
MHVTFVIFFSPPLLVITPQNDNDGPDLLLHTDEISLGIPKAKSGCQGGAGASDFAPCLPAGCRCSEPLFQVQCIGNEPTNYQQDK